MSKRALTLTVVVLLAAVAPATVAADAQDGSAYAGSHVTFDAEGDALVDYRVDDQTVMESVRVQSRSETESSLGVGASVSASAVTGIVGAGLSLDTSATTSATVQSESGAALEAHDNGHGSLVVSADDEAQYVEVGLGGDASADQSSDDRLVVTTANGTEQSYVVAGEGNVTMNDEGNVTAALERDSRLVVRSYPNERTSDDDEQERMIANGTAAASVYLLQEGGETVTDTVDYGQETTVEVSERSANSVNMTVSRTASEGKVVIVSASEAAFDAADDVQVTVDGEAAAEASSYAELHQAANGEADSSRYMVTQSSSAEAAADVAIAVDHFSERDVTMASGSDSTDGANDDADSSTSATGPGFGILAALSALAGVVGVRVWNEN